MTFLFPDFKCFYIDTIQRNFINSSKWVFQAKHPLGLSVENISYLCFEFRIVHDYTNSVLQMACISFNPSFDSFLLICTTFALRASYYHLQSFTFSRVFNGLGETEQLGLVWEPECSFPSGQ